MTKNSLVLGASITTQFVVILEATKTSLVHQMTVLHSVDAGICRFVVGGLIRCRDSWLLLGSCGGVAHALVRLFVVAGLSVARLSGVRLGC